MLRLVAVTLAASPLPQWLLRLGTQVEHALAPARAVIRPVLSNWWTLGIWASLNVVALGVLWWDVRERNANLASMMKLVWSLVVAYSGPVGLAIYWYSGRTQMDEDSLWKRGMRSTSHCYSGCGLGEVVGVTAATVILSASTLWVTVVTFALAYAFGFAFTVGPLMQEGVGLGEALRDALYSETPSITVMEIAAVGTDLLLARSVGWTEPLFWTSLFFSLTVGFVAAGVKEGMGNPAEMDGGGTGNGSETAASAD